MLGSQMKSILAFAFLFFGAAAQAEKNGTETPAMDSVAQCAADTLRLLVDPNVTAVLDAAYNNQIDLKPATECTSDGSKVGCTYDYSVAEKNYVQVCEAAGGQIVDSSYDIECRCEDGNANCIYRWDFTPECIGKTCNTTVPEQMLTDFINRRAEKMNQLPGISQCKARLTGVSAAAAMNLFIVLGGAALATLMLWV